MPFAGSWLSREAQRTWGFSGDRSVILHKPHGDRWTDVSVCAGDPGDVKGTRTLDGGKALDHPESPHNYTRQCLMKKPNQAMRQMAQEEVRGQGSEVVYFIDRVLPTSHNPPIKPDLGFASIPCTGLPDVQRASERQSRCGEGAASQGRGCEEGQARGRGSSWALGRGPPEALPGLASPSLP